MFNQINVRELQLFIENDSELYASIGHRFLAKKYKSNKYKSELAIKVFYNIVHAAAKKYDKMFSYIGAKTFSVADKNEVARLLESDFKSELELGNWD